MPYGYRRAAPYTRRLTGTGYGRRTGGMKGVEVKFFDTSIQNAVIVANGNLTGAEMNPDTLGTNPGIGTGTLCVNSMAQGSTASQRIGREISMVSLEISGTFSHIAQAAQTAADVSPTIVFCVVVDRQANAAANGPQMEDVFTNVSQAVTTTTSLLRNLNNIKRYQIIKYVKVRLPMPTIAYNGTAGQIFQGGAHSEFSINLALKGMKVVFSGTGADFGDIVTNAIGCFCISTSTSAAPLCSYNARLRYTDL